MQVRADWTELGEHDHDLWSAECCLYAYLHPVRSWLLYIGKADYCTVRSRMRGDHKNQLFSDVAGEFRIDVDALRVLHGYLHLGKDIDSPLLCLPMWRAC